MEHGDTVGGQDSGDLIPDPHHAAGGVGGAVVACGGVALPLGQGIGLAAVGVDNEHLRAVEIGRGERAVFKLRGVQCLGRGILDIHAPYGGVAFGIGDLYRLGWHAVIAELQLLQLHLGRRGEGGGGILKDGAALVILRGREGDCGGEIGRLAEGEHGSGGERRRQLRRQLLQNDAPQRFTAAEFRAAGGGHCPQC